MPLSAKLNSSSGGVIGIRTPLLHSWWAIIQDSRSSSSALSTTQAHGTCDVASQHCIQASPCTPHRRVVSLGLHNFCLRWQRVKASRNVVGPWDWRHITRSLLHPPAFRALASGAYISGVLVGAADINCPSDWYIRTSCTRPNEDFLAQELVRIDTTQAWQKEERDQSASPTAPARYVRLRKKARMESYTDE